jgi:hypothetical protein
MTSPDPNHILLKRIGYSLDIRVLEIKAGPRDAKLFDETGAEQP